MNFKNVIFSLIFLIIVAGVLVWIFVFKDKDEGASLANPAAVNCIEKGGDLENVEFNNGSDSICIFNDGSMCWQWDYYRGDCNKGDLKVEVVQEGTGGIAKRGDTVKVHYTGKLTDGTVFDSSVEKGVPYSFTLGRKGVIDGWEFGVLGMKTGEKRILTISPNLGYGSVDYGPIPANSTLIFEVELLEVI